MKALEGNFSYEVAYEHREEEADIHGHNSDHPWLLLVQEDVVDSSDITYKRYAIP